MVGPPSDELNCSVCNETSDATVVFDKAHSLWRRHPVSVPLIVKFWLGLAGALAVLLACCGHHEGERRAPTAAIRQPAMTAVLADASEQTVFLSP
jgi:hypothetical protein